MVGLDQDNKMIREIGKGTYILDTGYLGRKNYTACYLIEDSRELAIIETNTNHAVPLILEAVSDMGLAPEDVKYVIVTHIHLDHAGGAGLLLKNLPKARLFVHPRGYRHMADPQMLIKSVKTVYGEKAYQEMYGEIMPVPRDRMVNAEDRDQVMLGKRNLTFLNAPGHARHHNIILDSESNFLFTGDAFGLSYPIISGKDKIIAFPSTSPTQFDPDEVYKTSEKILDLNPEKVLLTHFGEFSAVSEFYTQIKEWIDFSVESGKNSYRRGIGFEQLSREIESKLWVRFEEILKTKTRASLTLDQREFLKLDLNLNAQGTADYLLKINSAV